jgi:hypothetical protein
LYYVYVFQTFGQLIEPIIKRKFPLVLARCQIRLLGSCCNYFPVEFFSKHFVFWQTMQVPKKCSSTMSQIPTISVANLSGCHHFWNVINKYILTNCIVLHNQLTRSLIVTTSFDRLSVSPFSIDSTKEERAFYQDTSRLFNFG